jgi:hypothetical protein
MGFMLCVRWLVLFFDNMTKARTPSLILAAILILIGFQLWMFGLVADVMAVNRKILEDVQLRLRRSEFEKFTNSK